MGAFDAFRTGLEVGGALGAGHRQREQQDAQAGAFSTGGWEGAAKMAGSQGNFEAARGLQQQATTQQSAGIDRMREALPVLARVGETLSGIPEAERGAAAQRFLPVLERLGIPPDQLAQADWSDQGLAELRALGGLSRYADIRTLDDGSIVGIGRDGSSTQLQAPSLTQGAPTGHRYTDTTRTQLQRIPGWEPQQTTIQMMTPDQVAQAGLPEGNYQQDSSGRISPITPPRPPRSPYNETASAAAQYASRMAAANATLLDLEQQLTDPAGVYIARAGFGSQAERQIRQAQREFVNAILRKESGAVIADSEFASASQQYFPQPGDGPDVIAQKRMARQRAIQGLVNASQGAYEEWYGEGSGAQVAKNDRQGYEADGSAPSIAAPAAPAAPADRRQQIEQRLRELDAIEQQSMGGR